MHLALRHSFRVAKVGQTGHSERVLTVKCTVTPPAQRSPEPTPTSSPASSTRAERLPGHGGDNGRDSSSQNGGGGGSAGRNIVDAVGGGGGDGGGGHNSGRGAGRGLLEAMMWPAVAVAAMLAFCGAAGIHGTLLAKGMTGAARELGGKHIEKAAREHGGEHIEKAVRVHGEHIEKAARVHGSHVQAGLCWAAGIGSGAYVLTHFLDLLMEVFARRGGNNGDGAGSALA